MEFRPRILFEERDIDRIEIILTQICNVVDISWEFFNSEVRVDGLLENDESLVLGHPRSAVAFLEGFMEGYNLGFGDGRENGNSFAD